MQPNVEHEYTGAGYRGPRTDQHRVATCTCGWESAPVRGRGAVARCEQAWGGHSVTASTRIRAARADDAAAIRELVHEIAPTVAYGTPAQVGAWLDAWYTDDTIRDAIAAHSKRFIVSDDNGAISGAIFLEPATGYFGGLYVRNPGHGTGSRLMAAMLDTAADLDLPRVEGEVLASNTAMLHLTMRHGFRALETTTDEVYFIGSRFTRVVREAVAVPKLSPHCA